MFTSRAEYRLLLREDNADLRLTEVGRNLGLVSDLQWEHFARKREFIEREYARFKSTWVQPATPMGEKIEALLAQPLAREYSLLDLLRRPQVDYQQLMQINELQPAETLPEEAAEQLEIQAKYAGYIGRQTEEVEKMARNQNTPLPLHLDYAQVVSLSNEVREKFKTSVLQPWVKLLVYPA